MHRDVCLSFSQSRWDFTVPSLNASCQVLSASKSRITSTMTHLTFCNTILSYTRLVTSSENGDHLCPTLTGDPLGGDPIQQDHRWTNMGTQTLSNPLFQTQLNSNSISIDLFKLKTKQEQDIQTQNIPSLNTKPVLRDAAGQHQVGTLWTYQPNYASCSRSSQNKQKLRIALWHSGRQCSLTSSWESMQGCCSCG